MVTAISQVEAWKRELLAAVRVWLSSLERERERVGFGSLFAMPSKASRRVLI